MHVPLWHTICGFVRELKIMNVVLFMALQGCRTNEGLEAPMPARAAAPWSNTPGCIIVNISLKTIAHRDQKFKVYYVIS